MTLRVCMWGTFARSYARNQVLIRALTENGIEVILCHEPVWEHTKDKTKGYKGLGGRLLLLMRLVLAYTRLILRYPFQARHDVLLVGYLGHFDMLVAAALGFVFRRPVIFDAFLSLYDTTVRDRSFVREPSLVAWGLKLVDAWSCRLATHVLLDTEQHSDYFHETFGVGREKLFILPVGADDRVYHPDVDREQRAEGFTVLHYCTYAPLHGSRYILEAARILEQQEPSVRFVLIGEGQVRGEIEQLARDWQLSNVEFVGLLEPSELVKQVAASDLCLGIFGESEKAHRVVPNKVYQCMAMGKPVLTGRSPAAETLLEDGRDAFMCDMANGEAIAETILRVFHDHEQTHRIAAQGRRTFVTKFSPKVLGAQLKALLEGALKVPVPPVPAVTPHKESSEGIRRS